MSMNIQLIILALSVFIIGCKPNRLVIKNNVTVDEYNQLSGVLTLQNCTKDTMQIPRYHYILPKETEESSEYSELYKVNGKTLDTIKSAEFHFSITFWLEEEPSLYLPPLKTHEYGVGISQFYSQLGKGRYLLRVCFKPEFDKERDTCIVSKFRLKRDLDFILPLDE